MSKFKGAMIAGGIAMGLAGAALAGSATAAPAGDPVLGKKVFMRCVACHAVTPNAPMKIGPNLSGVAGRKAGGVSTFKYSAAMKKASVKWDDATLDKWLTKPSSVVPGTSMAFAGIPNPAERAAVIAYLKKPVP